MSPLLSGIFVPALLATCEPETEEPVCEPGATQRCACPGSSDGVQECRDDRSGWQSCQCLDDQDAGVATDAAGPADSAAGVDSAAGDAAQPDSAAGVDSAQGDAAQPDSAADVDSAQVDAVQPDSAAGVDSAAPDAGQLDSAAGVDSAQVDAAQVDSAAPDAGPADSEVDAGMDPAVLTWVPIPGGSFDMGCSTNDNDCFDSELPTHTVTISAFEMTATEITQQQYQDTMGTNPSAHTGCAGCPVEQVTWAEAEAFCQAIGGRLPTEAEWEYAARAGTWRRFTCGSSPDCLDDIAWYRDNSDIGEGWRSHPVGGKTANDFGLYDMLGNAQEWVRDWFSATYYSISPAQDPTGPRGTVDRVVRGGSFAAEDLELRVSRRLPRGTDTSAEIRGMRCARVAP